jgi:hypothetical protein
MTSPIPERPALCRETLATPRSVAKGHPQLNATLVAKALIKPNMNEPPHAVKNAPLGATAIAINASALLRFLAEEEVAAESQDQQPGHHYKIRAAASADKH